VPFIRAISETSPTSQLNVTFLQPSVLQPNDAGRSRGQRTAAYNCRNVGICVMLAGIVPVRRFSPSSLPGRNQCETEAAQTDRAWATYRVAMDGIEETKAGNRPVSEFRVKFLRTTRCERRAEAQWGHWGARGRVPTMQPLQRDQTPSRSRASRALLKGARFRSRAVKGTTWARRVAHNTILRGRTSMRVGAAA
jgi:hypothetical protein